MPLLINYRVYSFQSSAPLSLGGPPHPMSVPAPTGALPLGTGIVLPALDNSVGALLLATFLGLMWVPSTPTDFLVAHMCIGYTDFPFTRHIATLSCTTQMFVY